MADRLTIINAALSELGEEQLEFTGSPADFTTAGAIDPEDDLQVRCAALYPQVRALMLNAYPWSWLLQRAQLVEEPPPGYDPASGGTRVKPPEWPYLYRYAVPEPHIESIRALFSESYRNAQPRVYGWEKVGLYIFADFLPAWCLYQRRVAEEAWPDLFVNAMTAKMAARLSMSLKEDIPTTRWFEQQAQAALAEAKRVDAQSHPSPAVEQFQWVEARIAGETTLGYGRYV